MVREIEQIEQDMVAADNPRDTKAALAHRIVERYYDESTATQAQIQWDKQFREGEKPTDVSVHIIDKTKVSETINVVSELFNISNTESRRKIQENGVRTNGRVIGRDYKFQDGDVVQLGKRNFKKLEIKKWSLRLWRWRRR